MSDVHQQRRAAVLAKLPSNSIAIVVGYQQKVRSKNIKYHFRQDNDFLYLTGFAEPDAVAVLEKESGRYHLFCRPKDPAQETNFGTRAGIEGAKLQFGADDAYAIDELERTLPSLIDNCDHLYISDELGRFDQHLIKWCRQQRHHSGFDIPKRYTTITPLASIIHPMRVVKGPDELAHIRSAVTASIAGHNAVMRACKPGKNERELAALFDFTIAQHGCNEVAYPNIVAGGNNACCLHYEDNCSPLQQGQMLLIDAGGEYQHYAADITRSYPVNGQFNAAQKSIYNIVLSALDAAITKVKPGTPWHQLYDTCMQVMAEGLLNIGLLEGDLDEIMAKESYKRFTVHKTGHWLGMDVHDVGPYHDSDGKWRTLSQGMVFTIEPGIYIPTDALDVPVEYRGMGIRIEDDILVTDEGHENLSKSLPRTVAEIESLMNQE